MNCARARLPGASGSRRWYAVAALVLTLIARTGAQAPASRETQDDSMAAAIASAARSAQRTDEPATLMFANRPVVVFRATVLSRTPAARADDEGTTPKVSRYCASATAKVKWGGMKKKSKAA